MTPERYQRVGQIYRAALEVESEHRADFVARACGSDDALRQEVESLVAYAARGGGIIDQPALEVAAKTLADDLTTRVIEKTFGRYRILSPLGKGGMGEVYLGEDTLLKRKIAIKLLPAAFTLDSDRVRRFAREAQTASALNHPSIITIYEIGVAAEETGSQHYIVTEYIEGVTLRQRMLDAPLKRMSQIEVLGVAVQIAAALVAAHEAGIVHRDIKPENVMVRRDGYVKVLDFGLAKLTETSSSETEGKAITTHEATTRTGIVMGTPRYMSPEQARGEKADARTDIFSLGVMIYEMIAGCPPFSGETSNEVIASILKDEPVPVTSHVSDAAPEVERILDKSLRKDRGERYQSASELLQDLKQLKQDLEFTSEKKKRSGQVNASHPATNKRNLMAILALAGFVIAATIAWSYLKRPPILVGKDTILLADFENKTGDDVFNGPLKQGLAIQLEQSPFLQLFPEPQVRQTLRLMGRQPTEDVTAEVAREICVRKELKAFIAGSIAPLGSDYVITLDAINGQTGDVVAQALVQAGDKEHVLMALSQAATQLREKLGESLRSIQQFNRPLQEVTTSNLMAYKDAIAGMDHAVSGRHWDAIPFFERAIEIDDGFAYAHLSLAISYSRLGHVEVAERYAEKAYALRGRAGEIEKSRIIEWYHGLVTGNVHERIKTLALHRQTFPQEYTGPNDLALCYNQIGQFDQALIEARESIRLNPLFPAPYGYLAVANLRLNRFDEGNDALTQAVQQGQHSVSIHETLYQLASVKGDTLGMRQQITWAEGRPDSYIGFDWQAATAASKGQWLKSQELSRRASDLAVSAKVKDLAAQYTTERAARGAVFGDCRRATVDAAQGLALARTRASLTQAALALALCGETSRAKPAIDEIASRYPEDTLLNSIWLPSIRAAMELRSDDSTGRAAQAIEHLQSAKRYEAAAEFWPQYLRGLAYLKLGKAAEAATEFKKILDHRGQGLLSPLYPLAYLGSAQATALSDDMAASRKAYESLLIEWKDADSNLLSIFKPEKSDKLRGRIH